MILSFALDRGLSCCIALLTGRRAEGCHEGVGRRDKSTACGGGLGGLWAMVGGVVFGVCGGVAFSGVRGGGLLAPCRETPANSVPRAPSTPFCALVSIMRSREDELRIRPGAAATAGGGASKPKSFIGQVARVPPSTAEPRALAATFGATFSDRNSLTKSSAS